MQKLLHLVSTNRDFSYLIISRSSGYKYGKRRKESFDLETFEEKLLELGESTTSR